MGERWEPFVAYNLELARAPSAKIAGRLMRELGLPRIPADDHDRAIRLRIAEAASARYGWPLHVTENCADDPPRDQPEAFLEALRAALGTSTRQEVAL